MAGRSCNHIITQAMANRVLVASVNALGVASTQSYLIHVSTLTLRAVASTLQSIIVQVREGTFSMGFASFYRIIAPGLQVSCLRAPFPIVLALRDEKIPSDLIAGQLLTCSAPVNDFMPVFDTEQTPAGPATFDPADLGGWG
jgi:hypothetical protein